MQLLTDIASVRKWVEDNTDHPEWQPICDELALLEALDKQMHRHFNEAPLKDQYAQLPELQKKSMMYLAKAEFIKQNKREAEDDDVLFTWLEELKRKDAEESAKRAEAAVKKFAQMMGIPESQMEAAPTFKDGLCGHDQELVDQMQPSFDTINQLLNGKQNPRRNKRPAGEAPSEGRIS